MYKWVYSPPLIKVELLEMESSIAATSIAPHQENGTISQTWEQEEVVFDKVQW